ncbi:hypothetical protein SOVF_189950, partial [Spinacia oleracea]
MARSSKIGYFN